MKRRRQPEDVTVPDWSGFGIGYQLTYGSTFGALFDAPMPKGLEMPSDPVLRAAWEKYSDRFDSDKKPWARLVFDDGMSPDDARATVTRLKEY